jgi:two-component system cell cycle response regulator DivK
MSLCILIIEDDGPSLMLAQYLFESAGHRIVSAATGAEGVEKALQFGPDLILCDLQLPVLTGYEVRNRLVQCQAWRPVPIVAVTASSMMGDREKILAAGFAGYISKPIAPTTFVAEVEAFLPPSAARTHS